MTFSIQCQVPIGSETWPGINTECTKITNSDFLYIIIRNRLCSTLYPYSTQAMNCPNLHELIFFLFGGIREVSFFFSPIVMSYESFLIQIRCRYEYSGESAQFGWNRARMHYD